MPQQNTTDWVPERTEIYFLWFWKLEIPDGGPAEFSFWSEVSSRHATFSLQPSHVRRGNLYDWITGKLTRLRALLKVVTPLKGLEKRITLAFQRSVNLDAQEQWAGLLNAKINLLQAQGVTTHLDLPSWNLGLDHLVKLISVTEIVRFISPFLIHILLLILTGTG